MAVFWPPKGFSLHLFAFIFLVFPAQTYSASNGKFVVIHHYLLRCQNTSLTFKINARDPTLANIEVDAKSRISGIVIFHIYPNNFS